MESILTARNRFIALIVILAPLYYPVLAFGQATDDMFLDRLLEISTTSQFSWSPVANQIVYTSNASGTNQIYLLNMDNGDSRQLTRHSTAVADPRWVPDGKSFMFLTDPGWQERYEVWSYNMESQTDKRILFNTGAIQRNVRWSPDNSQLAMESSMGGNFDLVSWSTSDPVTRPLVATPADESSPEWFPDGKSVAYLSRGSIWRVSVTDGEPERLVSPGLGARIQSPEWSPDGQYLLFATDVSGYWNIGIYSVTDGSWEFLAAAPYEQNEPSWSADGKQVAFISTQGFDKRVAIVDLASRQVEYITGPGSVSSSPRWSPRDNRLAFLMSTPQQTSDLWLYEEGRLEQLTDSMAGWDSSKFSSPEPHTYLAREGFEIPGLLYKPVNFNPDNEYPVVIMIHGGFYGQWINSFEQLGQYLLHRGMLLFYPNPRGGGGYGRNYERLNDGDWGGGDVDDLIRAHDYLMKLPYVDKNHVGIWGGSYGGYLVYALVTTAPERFQAAVVRAGISELRSHMLERLYAPARFNDTNSYSRQLGGLPDENPDFYYERSPLNRVDLVNTPMLIMHGLRDNRVSPSQSWIWVDALRENRGRVELVEFPDEDHSLLRSKTTMRVQLNKISTLFERHLNLQ